jgi:hypothetical protein
MGSLLAIPLLESNQRGEEPLNGSRIFVRQNSEILILILKLFWVNCVILCTKSVFSFIRTFCIPYGFTIHLHPAIHSSFVSVISTYFIFPLHYTHTAPHQPGDFCFCFSVFDISSYNICKFVLFCFFLVCKLS